MPGPDDIYVSLSQIRRFNLRTGDLVGGQVRAPKDGERYFALIKIETVNDARPEGMRSKPIFDALTPIRPETKIQFTNGIDNLTARLMDHYLPVGSGSALPCWRLHRRTASRCSRTSSTVSGQIIQRP